MSYFYYCKDCLTVNLRPNASFSEGQSCPACIFARDHSESNKFTKLNFLKNKIKILKRISRKKHNFDCLVGISGGKDSTRQAQWVRDRLGLNPLLVCCSYPPLQMSQEGANNLSNLISMGFDIFVLNPAPQTSAKLNLKSFLTFGNVLKPTELALFSTVPRIAADFGINIILWGENVALQVGDSETLGEDEFDASNLKFANTLVEGGYEWLFSTAEEEKVNHYLYPSESIMESKKISVMYLGPAWDDFTTNDNATSASLSGLSLRPGKEEWNGDLSNASCLDEDFFALNLAIRYYKYGWGSASDSLNQLIRSGDLTRNQAIKLAEKYDGICDDSIINNYCKYVGISRNFFWNTVNNFTNKKLFKVGSNTRPKRLFEVGKSYS